MTFVEGDALATNREKESFDLVHDRLVAINVSARETFFAEMVALLQPHHRQGDVERVLEVVVTDVAGPATRIVTAVQAKEILLECPVENGGGGPRVEFDEDAVDFPTDAVGSVVLTWLVTS